MQIDHKLLGLILLTALLQAVWNTLMKLGEDQLVINALILATSVVLALFFIPFATVPPRESWPYIAASTVLQTAFLLFRGESYRFGDINRIVPLMRGVALVAIAIAATLIAGEPLSLYQIGGLAGILLGILALTFVGGRSLWDGWLSVVLALAAGLALAGFTFIDGLGVRHSDTQLGYLVWLYVISGIPIIVIAMVRRRASLLRALKANWLIGSVSGLLATAVYSVVIWAFSTGAFAPVIALRETSIVFTALSGSVILGEPFGRRRMAAAIFIVAGVLVLNL